MVGADNNITAIEHGTELFKNFSDAESFKIASRIARLSIGKLAGEEGNRLLVVGGLMYSKIMSQKLYEKDTNVTQQVMWILFQQTRVHLENQ